MGVIPWFEFGFMAPADSGWQNVTPIGSPVAVTVARFGLKASTTEFGSIPRPVQQFIQDLILEIVSKYDIDGIQFDDHFGHRLLGYDAFTVGQYMQEHGQTSSR